MLELKNITKIYKTKSLKQVALDDVNINFRKSEFASILGASGSGKTTLLNIIGGLDKYSSGDLIINGVSTKKYKDKDWDSYRNHRIGFVFQSYNLISHQTVLQNVELALTLSGVSRKRRKNLAKNALIKVGLEDHIYKKPSELSGGQMQRVAIARALVNNPNIILADEPTGALDSETSIQIMNLLKEVAKDKLVIMVTHNPELAKEFSTRIINLKDGKVTEDSNPFSNEDIKNDKEEKSKKISMNFITALSLSFNNLKNKKGRTFLTAFAGSIGIIGIALILSLSTGVQNHIEKVQRQTLSQYPLTIDASTFDLESAIKNSENSRDKKSEEKNENEKRNNIISKDDVTDSIKSNSKASLVKNNLTEFKKYLDSNGGNINNFTNSIEYSYNVDFNIFSKDENDKIIKVNPYNITDEEKSNTQGFRFSPNMNISQKSNGHFEQLLSNKDILNEQYTVLSGKMPENLNELVLVIDEKNQISSSLLYSLNIMDRKEYKEIKEKIENGQKDIKIDAKEYDYDKFLGLKYKLILSADFYKKENNKWINKSSDPSYIKEIYKDGIDLEIVGILKANPKTTSAKSGIIGYTNDLTKYVITKATEKEVVKEQIENKETNILTNVSFDLTYFINKMSDTEVYAYVKNVLGISSNLSSFNTNDLKELIKTNLEKNNKSYEDVLQELGYVSLDSPKSINIYPKNFDSKEKITNIISTYNNEKGEEYKISYTDYIALIISNITKIINIISYVLIAFVAISLVVSSIMIAIITYISVMERRKEIGILRSIGASKKDVKRVFNAETVIEGLISGFLGIGITILLNIPINIIVKELLDIEKVASLPVVGAFVLILLSVVITTLSGLIPANTASKQDPVIALRSE